MNVTLEIGWNRQLGPAPITQGRRIKLQAPARRRKAAFDLSVDIDTGEAPSVFITIGQWEGHDIWPARFCRASKHSARAILSHVVQLFRRNHFFVNSSNLLFDFKRAIA